MVKAVGCLIGVGNGGFGFWFDSGPFLFFLLVEFVVGFSIGLCSLAAGCCKRAMEMVELGELRRLLFRDGAYNGALAWDFGEAGVCSRVVDGICRQRVWWWQ
ncbi:hypothetical protein GOBAR_AA09337 [Gossypium barbadense]|uniref:Transmembrane protein n=1 Tax=Gossypium barbadense TaxID=3634 RepID=A0A2P5Y6V5_GOSBA|nr:hypothetical protein GOBAR_AA09337 [Gossypium barbadense]